MNRHLLTLIVGIALFVPAARADYAVLQSGERLHIAGYLQQGANILLYVQGGTVVVPASYVLRFEPEDVFTPVPNSSSLDGPFAKQIQEAAAKNGLYEKLISSVIAAESNFEPHAISSKRAMGLMQLLPETASRYEVRNAFNPAENIAAGTRYLKHLIDRYRGNLAFALAAYNAGPERVAEYGGVPPFPETRNYIRRIRRNLGKLKSKQPLAVER